MPLAEESAYSYVLFLKESKASATKASDFLSAVGFVLGSLGYDGADDICKSPRIAVPTMSQALYKTRTKQRRPLTVQELTWLEYLVSEAPDIRDCVFRVCAFLHVLPELGTLTLVLAEVFLQTF